MSYLQQHLNEIEAEAAEKSRLACANAALIERAGDIMARINAAAERDIVFPSYHLESTFLLPSISLQKWRDATNDALIDALEAAGLRVSQLPARVKRNSLTGEQEVILHLAPGVDLIINPPVPRIDMALTEPTASADEALPVCAVPLPQAA